RELPFPSRVFDLISNMHQHFFSTWLQNVAKDLSRKLTRRSTTNGRNIDQLPAFHFTQRTAARTTNCPLHLFRLWYRRSQAEGDVVCEMRTTKRKYCGVLNCSSLVNN